MAELGGKKRLYERARGGKIFKRQPLAIGSPPTAAGTDAGAPSRLCPCNDFGLGIRLASLVILLLSRSRHLIKNNSYCANLMHATAAIHNATCCMERISREQAAALSASPHHYTPTTSSPAAGIGWRISPSSATAPL